MSVQKILLASKSTKFMNSQPTAAQKDDVDENPFLLAVKQKSREVSNTAVPNSSSKEGEVRNKKRKDKTSFVGRPKTILEKLALPIIVIFTSSFLIIRMIAVKGRRAVALAIEPVIKDALMKKGISDDYLVRASRDYLEPPLSPQTLFFYLKAGWVFLLSDMQGKNVSKLYYSLVKQFAKEITVADLMKGLSKELSNPRDFEEHMNVVLSNSL
ncbi:MAG: hypothetical protein SFU25_11525 [Candidatus Caenarcaniphilales bacterium]|nr:hypothetical protein [Candidatus Caenarcaniphilales bacterium]